MPFAPRMVRAVCFVVPTLVLSAMPTAALAQSTCPADLNRDRAVGSQDFAELLAQWGKCRGCSADLTGDGAVDGADLGVLLESWGACPPSDPADGRFWQHDDGSISYRGRSFASWNEYLSKVDPMAWRCGTEFAPPVDGGGGPLGEGGVAVNQGDCDWYLTTPRGEYQPGPTFCVTVVVHVIENAAATLGHVTPVDILDQIEVLNRDYSAARIRFQLATTDPAGNPTLGFDYHYSDDWYNDQGDYTTPLAWDTSKYLNIYTNTAASPGAGTLGYAKFPWDTEYGTPADRIVINWQHFGSDPTSAHYGLGRTCVHEVGHFLGLLHTFESAQDLDGDGLADSASGANGCATGCCHASGDLICDTDREESAHFGCAPRSTCGTGADPIDNFMDYSDDQCMVGFTTEQIGRMRCTLMTKRSSLAGTCLVPGDLNGDRTVDAADLSIFLSSWGNCTTGNCAADLNLDGSVDALDLAALLITWPTSTALPKVGPAWATVLEMDPDPAVVTNPTLRAAILATGLPWRVRDNTTNIEMLLVPAGSFQMGCSPSSLFACHGDELPVHTVYLTCPYYIGRYEVTQQQWIARMGTNPSYFPGCATCPVERVSLIMAQSFLASTGLRIPTEAEWEFACRAGTTTAFHSGPGFPNGTNDDALADVIAWDWNSACPGGYPTCATHPVGQKPANALGLHDMLGNAWEWTNDGYGNYPAGPQTNPTGPVVAPNEYRVLRGGQLSYTTEWVRASARDYAHPDNNFGIYGFRVARSP
jgi:formylglycine-generating enzyme required for sulfatase activity